MKTSVFTRLLMSEAWSHQRSSRRYMVQHLQYYLRACQRVRDRWIELGCFIRQLLVGHFSWLR